MNDKTLEDRKIEKLEAIRAISKIVKLVEEEIVNHKENDKNYAKSICLDILEYLENVYCNVEKWHDEKIHSNT